RPRLLCRLLLLLSLVARLALGLLGGAIALGLGLLRQFLGLRRLRRFRRAPEGDLLLQERLLLRDRLGHDLGSELLGGNGRVDPRGGFGRNWSEGWRDRLHRRRLGLDLDRGFVRSGRGRNLRLGGWCGSRRRGRRRGGGGALE